MYYPRLLEILLKHHEENPHADKFTLLYNLQNGFEMQYISKKQWAIALAKVQDYIINDFESHYYNLAVKEQILQTVRDKKGYDEAEFIVD